MADDMYEPTTIKRHCSYDGYSRSLSYSELSCTEQKSSYSLRRKREPLTQIKARLDQHVQHYSHESDMSKTEKMVTRSSHIQNETRTEYPLISLGSNLLVSIADSDSTKETVELLVHILIDHNLSAPSKTDIIIPKFAIATSNMSEISDGHQEDISDTSYHNRHKKKELFEKKAKNRAKEVYRHELHSKMLRQETLKTISSNLSGMSLASEKATDLDESWYKNLVENKDQPVPRVGVFTGQELFGIEQDRLEELIKSKEIQSDYLPVHTPVDSNVDHAENISRRRTRSFRKRVTK